MDVQRRAGGDVRGGRRMSDRRAASSIDGREPLYYVHGFTDSDYYSSSAGDGTGTIGTVRAVLRVLSVPTAGVQKIIACQISSGQVGWRLQWGLGGLSSISAVMGGAVTGWAISPLHTVTAGDVGDLLAVHAHAGAGGVHLYIGGAEVGTGSGGTITPTNPGSESVVIGRYPHAGGLSEGGHCGVVSLCTSPTVMTPSEIAADAAAIMSSGSRLVLPTMPGEDVRFVAYDIRTDSSSWHDRDGDNATLTLTGSVSVTAVP